MIFRFLGTGSGDPHPRRMTSATLIEGPRGGLLLDAGEGCSQRLAERDRWSQAVRTVLITHRHTDHLAGLPMLLSGYKGAGRTEPLEVLAPPILREALETWLNVLHLGPDDQPFELDFRYLEAGELRAESGHRGHVWLNDHLDPGDTGGSHSLRLELSGASWLFSGDIESFASIEEWVQGARGLVVETRHIDPRESVMRARNAGVDTILLTHVSPDLDPFPIEGAIWVEDNMLIDTDSPPAAHPDPGV
ncbi:MAG: Ribonuclease BN [Calditrichaeota bacterium]|nr:Ribonuclease BN [Calditrichota bacterium]